MDGFIKPGHAYLFSPGSFDQLGIDDFGPSLLALDIRAVGEELRDKVPLFVVLFHVLLQQSVLEEELCVGSQM